MNNTSDLKLIQTCKCKVASTYRVAMFNTKNWGFNVINVMEKSSSATK